MPEGEDDTRPSLIASAQAADGEAWARLVRIHSPTIFGWCKRAGLRSADAADVVQETWTSVARALPRFDLTREGATFRGWLYTVVRNKLRDRARELSSTPMPEGGTDARMRIEALPESESDESRSDGEAGEAAALRRALAELRGEFEERTCRMFWETAIAGRSPREVAGELGVTVDAVYQAKSRIARRLRELLANLG